TCYVVAERFSSADFLHGPIALVEPNFPVFLFAPSGVTWPSIGEMVDKLRGLKAETVVITDSGNREAPGKATRTIRLPRKLDELMVCEIGLLKIGVLLTLNASPRTSNHLCSVTANFFESERFRMVAPGPRTTPGPEFPKVRLAVSEYALLSSQ